MSNVRTLYVVIDGNKKMFGCRSQKLIEKFVATFEKPQHVIIVETTTPKGMQMGYLGTKILNAPDICSSNINDDIDGLFGNKFRTHVSTNQLGIPILTKANLGNFNPGFGKKARA